MDKDTFLKSGLIEQYIMGLASPAESAEVERMAAAYPEIEKKVREMQHCMERYVQMQAIPPPKEAKRRILNSIHRISDAQRRKDEAPRTGRPVRLSPWLATAAAAMVALLLTISFFLYRNQTLAQEQLASLSDQLQSLQRDYDRLSRDNGQVMQQYAVLKDLSTRHVAMEGTAHAPGAKLIVYWNPDHNKAYLNVVNLPRAPEGHQYQVWADVGGKHLNMGLLDQRADNQGLVNMPFVNGCQGFVLTLEREGGSAHPSVDKMYAHGEMSL